MFQSEIVAKGNAGNNGQEDFVADRSCHHVKCFLKIADCGKEKTRKFDQRENLIHMQNDNIAGILFLMDTD